ncbi:MAG: methyltransferase domain-containing protein [Planctomycetes bacterium]|nr:methyltransferase domain-containing protein [Planctomycetota bacterium]
MDTVADIAKEWNSATTLYVARKIDEIACGRALDILDVGCGDGRVMELLARSSAHRFWGYDLAYRKEQIPVQVREALGSDWESRLKFITDDRRIPFDDASFDLLFANQVFEHVRNLEGMFKECARVLRPDGTLIALFPFVTYPLEGHVKIPFVHWLRHGRLRRAYMYPFYALRIRPHTPAATAWEATVYWERWLAQSTRYHSLNRVRCMTTAHFEQMTLDPLGYLQARIDLQRKRGHRRGRLEAVILAFLKSRPLGWMLTHGFMGVLVAKNPQRSSFTGT